MNFVELPSGKYINLDNVQVIQPVDGALTVFFGENEILELNDADSEALIEHLYNINNPNQPITRVRVTK